MRFPGLLRLATARSGALRTCACALAIAAIGCTAQQAATTGSPDAEVAASGLYRIGAGDTLDVVVWKEPELSGPVRVRPDGMITVPLAGDVAAADSTPVDLAEVVRKRLTRYIDQPNVVVRVAEMGSRRFFVIGSVRSPGMYELRAGQTLLQALAVAGGFTEFADRGGVRILRRRGEAGSVKCDYNGIVRGASRDVRIEPDDTIVVP